MLNSGITYDAANNGNPTVTLRFQMRNVGKTPAKNTALDARIYPSGPKRLSPNAELDKLCQEMRARPSAPGLLKQTLFPNDVQIFDITVSVDRNEIDEIIKSSGVPEGSIEFFMPQIIACVDYALTFAEERHQTGIIATLNRVDPAHPNMRFVIDLDQGDVPRERLVLDRAWGGTAD